MVFLQQVFSRVFILWERMMGLFCENKSLWQCGHARDRNIMQQISFNTEKWSSPGSIYIQQCWFLSLSFVSPFYSYSEMYCWILWENFSSRNYLNSMSCLLGLGMKMMLYLYTYICSCNECTHIGKNSNYEHVRERESSCWFQVSMIKLILFFLNSMQVHGVIARTKFALL